MPTYLSSRLMQAGSAIVFLIALLCLRQLPAQAQNARGDAGAATRKTAAIPVRKSAQAGTKNVAASSRWRKPLPPPIVRAHTADREFAQTASRDQIVSARGTQFLLDAAYFGFDDVVVLLLNKGADPNGGPDRDTPPLFFALYGNHASTIQLLLARGALTPTAGMRAAIPPFCIACASTISPPPACCWQKARNPNWRTNRDRRRSPTPEIQTTYPPRGC